MPKRRKKTKVNNRCYEKLVCAIVKGLVSVCNEYDLLNSHIHLYVICSMIGVCVWSHDLDVTIFRFHLMGYGFLTSTGS